MNFILRPSVVVSLLVCSALLLLGCKPSLPSSPLKTEFYQSKSAQIYFKVWIEKEGDIPFDEFTWKVTKVAAPDGRRYSFDYRMTKATLLEGKFMNSHGWGGVNPWGSDCQAGDSFILEIPKHAPLKIDVPDTAKGLKLLPY